ncbi:hypothetical protein HPP92_019434 [Vanilla planifolia]|uniref:YDG domain-containing protein n=1 Tax=Vanilla planifolia TaxID=51239 RepID=A0A835Q362_VANPL|nr:hypothetical protein HPP92_019434 [Vanilla planifolia]
MEARTFSSKEDVVLDPKPLRSLAPMFPAPHGFNTKFTSFGTAPAVYVSSFGGPSFSGGGFPPGFPNLLATPEGTKSHQTPAANGSYHEVSPSTTTPINLEDEPQYIGRTTSGRKIKRPGKLSGYQVDDSETDSSTKKKSQMRKRSHKPAELAVIPSSLLDARNSTEEILMTFDALRRRLLQLDEKKEASKRADLKAGAIMMSNDLRTNMVKRIGSVPGVEIGDIFYFRIEMCLVGLHIPVMGGIDYMITRIGDVDDPVATSIVSSGSYDNEEGGFRLFSLHWSRWWV